MAICLSGIKIEQEISDIFLSYSYAINTAINLKVKIWDVWDDFALQARVFICSTDSDSIHKCSKQVFNSHVTDRLEGYLGTFLHKVTVKDLPIIFRP